MDIDAFRLSDYLPYRLAVLSERVSKRLSVVYAEKYDLTVAEWRVIVHLSNSGAVSVREIHERANLEKPRVSRAVVKLEAAGLVKKDPSAEDHRLVVIALTDKGRDVLNGIIPEALSYEASLLKALSPAEITALNTITEKLHAVLDEDPRAQRRSPIDTE